MLLEEFFLSHGIKTAPPGHEHNRPGWLQTDCPFCSKDWHHWRMGWNLKWCYPNCWACGSHSAYDAIREMGIPWAEAKEFFSGIKGKTQKKEDKPRGKLSLPYGVGPLLPAHRKYLKGRGFNPDTIEALWGIKGIGVSPQLGWRILIPIKYQGEVVSWTTRTIRSKGTRYISARPEDEAIPHKTILYGADLARHGIIIVEGPTDAWRVGPGAVATFGLAYSRSQLIKMAEFPIRAICFDNAPDAQRRAKRLAEELSVFPGKTHLVEIDADDPGSASKKEIKLLRQSFLE